MQPITLTKSERLILLNQYEILIKLDPERAEEYGNFQTIVMSGYRPLYGELGIIGDEIEETVYREVVDILDMFRFLKSSYENLADKDGIRQQDVEFKGFDGNGSQGHYGLVCFMIQDLGRWSEFRKYELNSHSEVLPEYRDMLARFVRVPDKFNLSKKQILEITS
jgi:uncharacterized protein YfbU (UPF0304 family)